MRAEKGIEVDIEAGTGFSTVTDGDYPIEGLDAIDWAAPWLCHLPKRMAHWFSQNHQPNAREDGSTEPLSDMLNTIMNEINAHNISTHNISLRSHVKTANQGCSRFRTGEGKPLRFVPQSALPNAMAYESFIAKTGRVPTRNNLHDLFNACVWLTYPRTKALLNRHQAAQIAEEGASGSRGHLRDAMTVFDENGAILVSCDAAVGQALKGFDWVNALVNPRAQWENPLERMSSKQASQDKTTTAVYVFGHALMEQLVTPRKPLCAHTLVVSVTADFFDLPMGVRMLQLDEQLAKVLDALLQQADTTPRSFSPLPILGVPYFWQANENPEFYQDARVFRAGRRADSKRKK